MSLDQQFPQRVEDEIDLFDLFEDVWKQKKLVIGVLLLFLTLGMVYAFLSAPVYKASTHLKPIYPSTLKPLSSLPLYPELSNDLLLKEFVRVLENKSFQEQFVNETESSLKQQLYPGDVTKEQLKELSKRFKLVVSKSEEAFYPYDVEFLAGSVEVAESELNRLVSSASEYLFEDIKARYKAAVKNEIEDINLRIEVLETKLADARKDEISRLQENHDLKLRQLEDQLAARQQAYLKKLNDRIKLLEEAFSIAAALNIDAPVTLNQLAKKVSGRIELTADFSKQNDPLYLRGTRLLGEELAQLKSREANYFPDETVRELETKIALMQHNRRIEALSLRVSDHPYSEKLQALKIKAHEVRSKVFPETFQFDFVSFKAIADPDPVGPKKPLVVMFLAVLGGAIGLVAGLVRVAFYRRLTVSKQRSVDSDKKDKVNSSHEVVDLPLREAP